MKTLNNFKLGLLASSIILASTTSALEIKKHGENINFGSLDQVQYQLKLKAPDGEIRTFTVENGDFSMNAKLLGLIEFENGQYKYQLTPVTPSNILAGQVRKLNDKEITKEYTEAFKAQGETLTGAFTIDNNLLVKSSKGSQVNDQDNQTKDIVHLDDVIINQSLCVGNDCVNGESFGFDTMRLKENNLRIHFQDTSSSASFPTNDWRIVINDSSNGGASYFAVEDSNSARIPFRIEAGAGANSLVVESDGDVGLGTINPVVDLHIVEGNTPTLRLEQDGSSGFTPQTWDVAGNETNFFIRDATNGSTLPFRIRPGAPQNSIYIETGGDIGMGTASPDAELEIENSTGVNLKLTHTGSNASSWTFKNNQDTGRLTISDHATRVPFKMFLGADNNLIKIGSVNSSTVQINGDLDVQGNITATGTITPDYVFAKGYKLKTIDEHAKSMWENKHLPFVEAAKTNESGTKGVFSINQRSQELLEELEIAHIYIQQLNDNLKEVTERLDKIEKQ